MEGGRCQTVTLRGILPRVTPDRRHGKEVSPCQGDPVRSDRMDRKSNPSQFRNWPQQLDYATYAAVAQLDRASALLATRIKLQVLWLASLEQTKDNFDGPQLDRSWTELFGVNPFPGTDFLGTASVFVKVFLH